MHKRKEKFKTVTVGRGVGENPFSEGTWAKGPLRFASRGERLD